MTPRGSTQASTNHLQITLRIIILGVVIVIWNRGFSSQPIQPLSPMVSTAPWSMLWKDRSRDLWVGDNRECTSLIPIVWTVFPSRTGSSFWMISALFLFGGTPWIPTEESLLSIRFPISRPPSVPTQSPSRTIRHKHKMSGWASSIKKTNHVYDG